MRLCPGLMRSLRRCVGERADTPPVRRSALAAVGSGLAGRRRPVYTRNVRRRPSRRRRTTTELVWKAIRAFDAVQKIGERVTGLDCLEAVSLGAADVPEMLELVAHTEPGPLLKRTVELGDYVGIRRHGTLVAMAGERLRFGRLDRDQLGVHDADPSQSWAGLSTRRLLDSRHDASRRPTIPARPQYQQQRNQALPAARVSTPERHDQRHNTRVGSKRPKLGDAVHNLFDVRYSLARVRHAVQGQLHGRPSVAVGVDLRVDR
jgi:hypothetical protein